MKTHCPKCGSRMESTGWVVDGRNPANGRAWLYTRYAYCPTQQSEEPFRGMIPEIASLLSFPPRWQATAENYHLIESDELLGSHFYYTDTRKSLTVAQRRGLVKATGG